MGMMKNVIYRLRGFYTVERLIEEGLVVGKEFNPQFPFFLDPSHCWLITIGDYVTFGPGVRVFAHDASTCRYLGYAKIGRVEIGNNVFVGSGSTILPGISIGDNSIIAAGSVVTDSVKSNSVYGGNPARFICSIDRFIERNSERLKCRPVYDETYTTRNGINAEKKRQQQQELLDGIGFVK